MATLKANLLRVGAVFAITLVVLLSDFHRCQGALASSSSDTYHGSSSFTSLSNRHRRSVNAPPPIFGSMTCKRQGSKDGNDFTLVTDFFSLYINFFNVPRDEAAQEYYSDMTCDVDYTGPFGSEVHIEFAVCLLEPVTSPSACGNDIIELHRITKKGHKQVHRICKDPQSHYGTVRTNHLRFSFRSDSKVQSIGCFGLFFPFHGGNGISNFGRKKRNIEQLYDKNSEARFPNPRFGEYSTRPKCRTSILDYTRTASCGFSNDAWKAPPSCASPAMFINGQLQPSTNGSIESDVLASTFLRCTVQVLEKEYERWRVMCEAVRCQQFNMHCYFNAKSLDCNFCDYYNGKLRQSRSRDKYSMLNPWNILYESRCGVLPHD
eukprot:scpid61515/ scgid11260/ 